MTFSIEWTHQDAFMSQPLREWTVDDRAAGKTRRTEGLTFATIYGAGHMVRSAFACLLQPDIGSTYLPGSVRQAEGGVGADQAVDLSRRSVVDQP